MVSSILQLSKSYTSILCSPPSSTSSTLHRFSLSYMNTALYPFTAVALTIYCFLPTICLFTGQFIVANVSSHARRTGSAFPMLNLA